MGGFLTFFSFEHFLFLQAIWMKPVPAALIKVSAGAARGWPSWLAPLALRARPASVYLLGA